MSRYYLLSEDICGADPEELQQELVEEFLSKGMAIDAYPGVDRMVLIAPDRYEPAVIEQCLEDMCYKIAAQWRSGPPSGKKLLVNLQYANNDQVVSATVDEGLLICALAGDHGNESGMKAAITALAQDNEFTTGYSPMDGSLLVQDVMSSVEFWSEANALKWSSFGWDPDEPMLEIGFTPEADIADGDGIIAVHVAGMPLDWKMPLRLLPDGVDPRDRGSLDRLATLPCAPEKVRLWASMMPFTVSIGNPEIIPEPDNGPSF